MEITRRQFVDLGLSAVCGTTLTLRSPSLTSAFAPRAQKTTPKFKWRIIEPWLDPDGKELFSHGGSILTWDAMLNTVQDSPLGRWIA